MADLDWLFGTKVPATFTAATTNQANMPTWYQDASAALIGKASGIASEPYTPYTGPRVAGLAPLQQQAINEAGNAGQAGGGNISAGANLTQNAGSTLFNQGQFDQFMTPYTEGVVNRIAELGTRNLTENLLPNINKTFIGSGLPFGTGHADFTARALRDTNESILGQQSEALQSAYDSAMTNYQNALTRQGAAGKDLASIGQAQTENDLKTGTYQAGMGSIGQANQQQSLDTAYQDFQKQQQYPLEQLNIINSILKGYSPTANTSSTTTATPQNAASSNTAVDALKVLGGLFGG